MPTGDRLRDWSQDEVNKTRGKLATSRWLTIVAVLIVAIAVGVTWLAPAAEEDDSNATLLLLTRSGFRCGTLADTAGQTLTIKSTGGTEDRILIQDVVDLTSIAECP
jgi:hypothetical protein